MTAPGRPPSSSYLPATDMPRFVREQMAFVGLGEPDVAAIRETAPLVLAHEPAITSGLYDHLLAWPETARFFLREDGSVDGPRLERRKHTLGRWLRESAEVATGHEFSYYLLTIALAHSHRPTETGPVPPHFMVGAMSLAQTALADLFHRELPDAREAARASAAWNKLLLVHLAVLLLGYLSPSRSA